MNKELNGSVSEDKKPFHFYLLEDLIRLNFQLNVERRI